jgi:predicted metal-dependent hydrolase
MDKRKYLGSREYHMTDGNSFVAKIYQKANNRGLSIRAVYGEMEIYVSSRVSFQTMDNFVKNAYNKYKDHIFNRPFMKEGIYIYLLGKKRYFTSDMTRKNDPNYFYVSPNCRDPLVRYKRMFLEYLRKRVDELGLRMGVDLSSYIIRTGLFLSYYGVCFPVKKQFKFDYRLFAYKPEVMDAVIIHEIAHTYEIHHNERFYTIVKMYCPDYDHLDHQIACGMFEGDKEYHAI